MVNRTWPSLTWSPSVNLRGPRKPFTRARRSTLSTAAARPMNSERAPSGLSSAACTRTAGGGPACCACAAPRPAAQTSAAIAKSRVIPISVPRLLAAWADCPTTRRPSLTKIKNSQTGIDCRHVAHPAFPSAVVLLPEGADRALRGRHAVRAGGRELRRSANRRRRSASCGRSARCRCCATPRATRRSRSRASSSSISASTIRAARR